MNVDVAIIGGGAAGLAAALSVPPKLKTAVFAKRKLQHCASALAQGGIAAALAQNDNPEIHAKDTLRAGDGLSNPNAVRQITQEAANAVQWLDNLGVPFNRRNGNFALGHEGGHSKRRIAHADDATGAAVSAALAAAAKKQNNIQIFENAIAVNLYARDACRGAYVLHLDSGQILPVNARAVILATGGAGKVYLYATTPPDATGDGVAMAYRAGCEIANMEFVQFHPTCLYHPLVPSFLITEAMRGEGARLTNAGGSFFLEDAELTELSPRDAVARAIDAEMKKTGADCAYLDLSARPAEFWRKRFPTIMRRCEELGLENKIPVVPAAHYCCGGVRAGLRGETNLPGLFAAGETACNGMHGANRLASNSLLECVVAGRRAAETASANPPPAAKKPMPPWDERRISAAAEDVMVAHNWEELRRIMWNYVGIARSDERLIRARRRIEWIDEEIEEYYNRHVVRRDFLELRNLVRCAALIVEGALSRRESRGLHFNMDCPHRAGAADTVFRKLDFERRKRAANRTCPFSGRPITANSLLDYAGKIIGFCNPGCRDKFAAAAAAGFAGAGKEILAARGKLDAA